MLCRQHRSRLYMLLVGALLLLVVARGRHIHKGTSDRFGRLTAEQVIRMSQPICETIAPQFRGIYIASERTSRPFNAWEVQCQDDTGHRIITLTWDADSGRLYEVGVSPQQDNSIKPALNAREAVAAARQWLSVLEVEQPSPRFHPVASSLHFNGHTWTMKWIATDRYANIDYAYIDIEGRTGDLLNAQFWLEPPTQAAPSLYLRAERP